jgi:2-dehydropantoate 2-reductase
MKVAIVGAGAMGSLFGGLLAESGQAVWLLDVWSEHVDAINAKGLMVEWQGETRRVDIKATTTPAEIGSADLIVIFVKSTQTRAASSAAAGLIHSDSLVLTLQNGMGNADVIAEFIDSDRVLAGTTAYGATLLGPGSIRHAGKGPTIIGMWSGRNPDVALRVADVLAGAGIATETVEDVRSVVWGKLLINVGINAITALTGIKNGELLDLTSTQEISRRAVEEAVSVAKAQGISVRDDAVEHVFEIARATAVNRSSMGQDVDHGRITEIEAINGVIVKEGARLGIDTPVNQTLTGLIETLQAHY